MDSKKFSSREQDEEAEILEYAPEKIHGPTKPTMAKSPGKVGHILNQVEVNFLINASTEELVVVPVENPSSWFHTYSSEEVNALIEGIYDSTHFSHCRD